MQKYAVVLAAGKGTRMKSKYPKVVHKVCGKEMVNHIIDVSKKSGVKDVVAILGHESEVVKNVLPVDTMIAMQTEQLGTGHAVKMAKEYINDEDTIVILCGDTPLIKEETLKRLFDYHIENEYTATVLTTVVENPTGYGRVIRDENGDLLKIVEQKDGNPEELATKEINSGIYCFKGKMLRESLDLLDNNNAQGEYYLTDTVKILRDKGFKVGAFNGSTIEELMGVNSRLELSKAEALMRKRINEFHLLNGVTIIDSAATYIEADVEIGQDTIIYPGNVLEGNTVIGKNCLLYPNSRINNSIIGEDVEIQSSVILESEVGNNTTVGPFAYIRPQSVIGKNVRIGDFVEIKKSTIGNNTKVSHLTYVGDAEVGEGCNFGCGTVTVNYDGKNKNKTIIGNNSFIGCNTNLISPVTVEDNTYIAAGSTITNDVKSGELAVARAKQRNIEGWVDKKGLIKKK